MMDKRVVDYDSNFRGLRVGDLIRPRAGVTFLDWRGPALVIDRILNAMMLGEGDAENYDAILIVVSGSRRHHVHVDDVQRVEGGNT
jgi:hypothetical protein